MESKIEKTANFPKRLFAYNIDITILFLVIWLLSYLIEQNRWLYFIVLVVICLYHVVMESSPLQGTLGKHYNGMKVTDNHGGRIGFVRSVVRFIAKLLSLAIGFGGFFMIYFRSDRKGLHDIIAGTRVQLK